MRNQLLCSAALMLGLLVFMGGSVKAQSYDWTSAPPNSDTAYISYSNSSGVGIAPAEDVYTDPFSVTPVNSLNVATGPSFTAYCIDLWHNENNQNPFSTIGSFSSSNSTALAALFVSPTTTGSGLSNELNYLGHLAINATSPDQAGAMQLAIWTVIDKNFSVTNFNGNTNLQSDYQALITLLGGTKVASGDFSSLAAYSASTPYGGGTVLQVNNGPTTNSGADQNLISWGGGFTTQSITPEPSTFVIAGLGGLAFIGYGLRRRSKV
jgi:hypothetical protein